VKAPLGTNKICVVILCTIDPWHYFHNLMSIGEAVDGVSEDNMMVAIGTVTEAAREETRVAVAGERSTRPHITGSRFPSLPIELLTEFRFCLCVHDPPT